jgi:hypothetical protein
VALNVSSADSGSAWLGQCPQSIFLFSIRLLLFKNIKLDIYRIVILPVVLYGCEAWSVILREEHRLRVFENRVLRKIFEPKTDEVTGLESTT